MTDLVQLGRQVGMKELQHMAEAIVGDICASVANRHLQDSIRVGYIQFADVAHLVLHVVGEDAAEGCHDLSWKRLRARVSSYVGGLP